ncbi:MAG: helix-hairpin-helix domain-containing protein [Balneolaceae bacterium]
MKLVYVTMILFWGLMSPFIFAQDSSKVEVEKQLEEAFEELDTQESGLTGEQLTQFLEDLAANPININSAGVSELLQVPGFNLLIARAVVDYRKTKPFESILELQEVKGIGISTFQRMSPYITVGGTVDRFRNLYTNPGYWFSGNKLEVLSRFQQNLEEQEGFVRPDSSGGYLGSPMKYYQRFRMQSNHFSVNLTQEKDAGETLNGINGFDYNSWHLALTNNGKLKSLVMGDYSLSVGQGLVLWTGGAFGKGREVIGTINKNERGIRAYGSAQETDFFRGMAATYGDQVQFTAFYSNKARTASETKGDTTRFPSSSGFHRTQSEIDRRNNIDQQTIGGRIKADTPIGLIGLTGYTSQFSSYIEKGTSVSDLYDFEGNSNSVLGIDYRGLVGSSLVFGEVAQSENGGVGGVVGMEAPVGFRTDIALLYRNYQKDFQSFLGTGFGESSGDPNNENGLYLGIKHRFNSGYTLSGYIDQYFFEAPRSGTTQSTEGYDVLSLIEGSITRNLDAYILIRNEIKDDEYIFVNELGREERVLGKEKRTSLRVQTEYQVNRKVRLRSRGEFVRFQSAGDNWESGFLVYQDLRLQLSRNLQLDTRITFFDTDSFNTRVYQFENDLLYVLSNVALSDQGQRMYAVVKYEINKNIQLWVKYSQTIVEDAQSLSSGLGEIEGNNRTFLGVQCRILIK